MKKLESEKKEIIPTSPKEFSDIEACVTRVKKREAVIVDFDGLPPHISRRMLDFLSGAAFALGGTASKIDYKKYLIIPKGVRITEIET